MHLRLTHTARYRFDEPVRDGVLDLRLRPRDRPWQHLEFHQIVTRPHQTSSGSVDRYGNEITHLELSGPLERLEIHAVSEVEVEPPPRDLDPGSLWNEAARVQAGVFGSPESPRPSLAYRRPPSEGGVRERARRFGDSSFRPDRPLVDVADELMTRLRARSAEDPAALHIEPPLEDVFDDGRGLCADVARAALACLRERGLAARFVGGYIVGPIERGEIAPVEPHAWIAVRLPDGSWRDISPLRSYTQVTVAWGAESSDVAQVSGGLRGGGRQTLDVVVRAESI